MQVSLSLQTRDGWDIPNEVRMERPRAALLAAAEIWKTQFPENELRSASARYNFAGMVLANRRVWVFPEDVRRIVSGDGYRRLPSGDQAERGDIVVYHDDDGEPCHIGIVIAKRLFVPGESADTLIVLSQWGADGEYIHDMSRVPLAFGRASEFWTDRRSL